MPHFESSKTKSEEDITTHRDFELQPNTFHVQLPQPTARSQDLLQEICTVIQAEWGYSTRCAIDRVRMYETSTVIVYWEEERTFLAGSIVSGLLKHGWAISGIKGRKTYVSPVTRTAESGSELWFEGRNEDSAYEPKVCDACGDREKTEFVDIYNKPDDFESRLENNEYIPRYWHSYFKLCDECELPEHVEERPCPDEPDFDSREYPNYSRNST